MKRICSICARGGSKGVPDKNITLIRGIPLIAHSVLRAKETGLFDLIACSSDSPQILQAAKNAGADLMIERPAEMATDAAPKVHTLYHALTTSEARAGREFDTYVDLDGTSPLRNTDDIRGAVHLLESTGAPSVITGAPSRRSPYFNLVELDANGFVAVSKKLPSSVARRQDAPKSFDMNASIYVWDAAVFRANPQVFYPETRLFEMPEERSLDIDSPLDLKFVKFLMESENG